jgi:hypothetical protein
MSADFANVNASGVNAEGTYTPDKLCDRDTIQRKATIDAGNLARGSLLGKITATGKYILSLAAASDGSEVPDAVLLEPVDATGGDKEAAIAIKGRFAIQGMTIGAGHTAASVDSALRDKGIYLENVAG